MNANLYGVLHNDFESSGDRPFLTVPGDPTVTYRGVDARSARIARALVDAGVGPGDRVVVQVAKSVDNVALYLATLRVGSVYVPINTAYTHTELDYFIADSDPALVVLDPDISIPNDVVTHTLGADGAGSLLITAGSARPFDEIVSRRPEDPAAMIYTSGTTGRAKGAVLSHQNLATNAAALHELWAFEPGDVVLHFLPVFHAHGLMFALHTAMLNASEVVFLPRFDVTDVLAALPRCTVMMAVPTHYTRLLADDRLDVAVCSSMRLFTSGSAPLSASTHRAFHARTGHRIVERYGMTETGAITSNPYDGDRIPGTVGFALPGVELRVCTADGDQVPSGDTGVVEVRGPNVFAGYWRRPDESESGFRSDGFFVTGDVGRLDTDGRLTLDGRTSDMIISGGLNIHPREIELVLDECPGVTESAVVGLDHPDLGEAVTAFLVVAEQPPTETLSELMDDRLARFKHPRRYVIVDALPRNAMGKVQKTVLRAEYADLYSA